MEEVTLTKLRMEENIFSLQKCCLSVALIPILAPRSRFGNYAFVQISPGSKCVCKLIWKRDLHHSFCQIDSSVVTFDEARTGTDGLPNEPVRTLNNSISVNHIKIAPLVNIKTLSLSIVFENAKSISVWQGNKQLLLDIIKNILRLYIVVESSVVYVKKLNDRLKSDIKCFVIHHVTKHVKSDPLVTVDQQYVGKITSATKLNIVKLLSKYKFEQIQNSSVIPHLGGLNEPYKELKEIISHQNIHKSCTGIKSCNQVLLVGPPGCGKTSLVHRVAADCDAVVLTILGPEICSPKPGDTEKTLRQLFQQASELTIEGTCVILLDEVDSLCPKRGRKESSTHVTRMTAQLLTLLDKADKVQGLVVAATTSSPFAIDPAIRRPGRLEKEIYIGVPSEMQRREILNILVNHMLTKEFVGSCHQLCNSIASLTPGYVGADLSLLYQDVVHRRFLHMGSSKFGLNDWLEDFRRSLATVRPSSLRGGVGVITIQPQSLLDIGGLDNLKRTLQVAVEWPLLHPKSFARLALPHPRGVLLYGPPGCAKTTLACALASSTNTTFLAISAAELYSPFVGDAEKTVLELFHRARLGAPTILFIDEIDALVGSRAERENVVQERVLSAFLTEMDGIGVKLEKASHPGDENMEFTNSGVIVIAATNRPDMLDDALLRPGRFDKKLYVPPPDVTGRLDILKIILSRTPLAPCVDLEALAKETDFYSGADLMNLCKEAGLRALTESGMDTTHIQHRHFMQAIVELKPSLNQQLLDWYDNHNKN